MTKNKTIDKNRTDTLQKQVEYIRERESFITDVFNSIPYPLYVIDANDLTVKAVNLAATSGELSENTKCYSYIRNRNKP